MKLIAENTQSTVVSRYEYKPSKRTAYQSEEQLENALIAQLQTQGYEYLDIHTGAELEANLRKQLERLNDITFTDNEWQGFFNVKLCNKNATFKDKTVLLQDDRTAQLVLMRDDNTFQNIKLIDKKHIHENHLQVIHQYKAENGKRKCRYDVTILVNGLPMVHIELKRRGVAIKEAFNQINRYRRDAFGTDNGLFDYVQIFVISNGTETKYYSNTTSQGAFTELNRKKQQSGQTGDEGTKTCDSFEFTSYWADSENNPIRELTDFTATFFARHTLLNILTRYCVFTADRKMLVMRPYQIAATEAILQRILISTNQRTMGSINAGGYIWHTTGSGKTLTSFKTAQLCTQLDYVDKVLFVVDRKDLDYQTIREYEKFKKGCVSHNKSTSVLHAQLSGEEDRIIITTIQKLNQFCKAEQKHPIYDRHVVIIFDECHRSQFGDMHNQIVKRFHKYHIFGFTGTPIFSENAQQALLTTEQVFGKPLHIYTVINAIADENVLPFRVEYIKTVGAKPGISEEEVRDIDRERALLAPERIHNIVEYILQHFDQKTYRNRVYKVADKRVTGFNSILATASIDAAKLYYTEFLRQQDLLPEDQRLKIAIIYSYGQNEEVNGILDEENSDSAALLDRSSRDFLESAIADYNQMFNCNYDTSSDQFGSYYKDVSERMKKRELDLLIVVNMFLTGFDATTLNTLWVDKNLRQHGLMQAYSRTNRILNSIKQFGNIVCFRNLENETNDAITLFGDKDACNIVLLRSYEEYINGYTDENGKQHIGFMKIVDTLKQMFPLPINNPSLMGEDKEKEFIRMFGSYLRMANLLTTFDRFDVDKANYISPFAEQDYRSIYLDLNEKYRHRAEGDMVDINDDLTFEIELIKQVEINIDYILALIEKNRVSKDAKDNKVLDVAIFKAIGSSPALRNKRDLIEAFVRRYSPDKEVGKQWMAFVHEQAQQQLDEIIETEHLKREQTIEFMRHSFQIGEVECYGDRIAKCLPPMPLFGQGNQRSAAKQRVLALLLDYFNRFYDIYEFI